MNAFTASFETLGKVTGLRHDAACTFTCSGVAMYKAHLSRSAKKEAGKRLLDCVMAEDVGSHFGKDVLVDSRTCRKFLELLFLLCSAASTIPSMQGGVLAMIMPGCFDGLQLEHV